MTYNRIKNSIKCILGRSSGIYDSDSKLRSNKVVVHINTEANYWNRAAIELSNENIKIPSRRVKIICYPILSNKDTSESVRMSTNEWNDLALLLRDKRSKLDSEICPISP